MQVDITWKQVAASTILIMVLMAVVAFADTRTVVAKVLGY